jgi:hypothetical protein
MGNSPDYLIRFTSKKKKLNNYVQDKLKSSYSLKNWLWISTLCFS